MASSVANSNPPDRGGAAEATVARTVGLLRIGTARIALPLECIREVVRGLPRYGTLPIKAEGLLGAINVRGTIVPVLDLRPTWGWAADGIDGHVVVIMRYDGHLLGLRADAVLGIVQLDRARLCDLADGLRPTEMLATQAFESDGEIVTILDPARIVKRTGVPKVREQVERRDDPTGMAETFLLFSHGRSHLGIDADCVDAAVPEVEIRKNAMSTGFCLGTIEHRGHDVPVVDTSAAVGLGTGPRASSTQVVVIRFGPNTMLGLAVDAVRDIVAVAPAAILAMPALTRTGALLFRGMLPGEGEPRHLLLDLVALRRDPELVDLANLCRPRPRMQVGDKGTDDRNAAYGRAERYITYIAGREAATRLGQITEVLPFPTDIVPFVSAERGLLGLFMHRSRLVPLISLERVLTDRTGAIDKETARVLIVLVGDRHAAFVVEKLVSIDTAPPNQSSASKEHALMSVPFVMLGPDRHMVSHVDLALQTARVYSVGAPDVNLSLSKDHMPSSASSVWLLPLEAKA